MSKYEEMSDTDINKLVAEKQDDYSMFRFDYCNEPVGAWPIIVENKISVTFMSDGNVFAVSKYCNSNQYHTGSFAVEDKNPLRAAMIVYLMLGNV